MKHNQGMYISKDKCLACKLVTAPIFFGFGVLFTYKNYYLWTSSTPKIGKLFLVLMPTALYAGGAVAMYQALNIFKDYRYGKDIWNMLQNEGIFEHRDD